MPEGASTMTSPPQIHPSWRANKSYTVNDHKSTLNAHIFGAGIPIFAWSSRYIHHESIMDPPRSLILLLFSRVFGGWICPSWIHSLYWGISTNLTISDYHQSAINPMTFQFFIIKSPIFHRFFYDFHIFPPFLIEVRIRIWFSNAFPMISQVETMIFFLPAPGESGFASCLRDGQRLPCGLEKKDISTPCRPWKHGDFMGCSI